MPAKLLPQPLLLAAINALHDAEMAKQPLSARVAAVAQALGVTADHAEVVDVLRDMSAVLERLSPAAGSAEHDLLLRARALLQRSNGSPEVSVSED